MPSTGLISLQFKPGPNSAGLPRFAAIEKRLGDLRPAGDAVLSAMRKGPGSVGAQFSAQAEDSLNGLRPWPKTHAFGRRPAPSRTLRDTGKLENAWTGGSGSVARVTPNSFAIGVDTGVVPYAGVFQSQTPTRVRAKKMGARGRYAMGWMLGMKFGVWLSNKRLEEGFLIQPRRVGVNKTMLGRVRNVLVSFVTRGTTAVAA